MPRICVFIHTSGLGLAQVGSQFLEQKFQISSSWQPLGGGHILSGRQSPSISRWKPGLHVQPGKQGPRAQIGWGQEHLKS